MIIGKQASKVNTNESNCQLRGRLRDRYSLGPTSILRCDETHTEVKLWNFVGNLLDLQLLHRAFVAREGRLLAQLAQAMGTRKGNMFDTWMKQQSDLVQATASAFAEREVLEASLRSLDEVHPRLLQDE